MMQDMFVDMRVFIMLLILSSYTYITSVYTFFYYFDTLFTSENWDGLLPCKI